MKESLHVLFYIKKNQETADREYPIMGKITIVKSMVQFSCKMSVPKDLWNSGKATGRSARALNINKTLDGIKLSITSSFNELSAIKDSITAEQVKVYFQGISSYKHTLVEYFSAFNNEFQKRVGVNRKAHTCFEYQNALRILKDFLKHKYNLTDIPFASLNLSFIEAFDFYLRVELKRKSNTIIGIVIKVKRMVKLAISEGIITRDPFDGYIHQRPKPKQKYLTKEELDKIMNTPLDHPNRYLVRDMFLFSCFTGLAYRDMCNLTKDNIVTEENGELWIKTERQKTKAPVALPLLPIAIQIIEKYKHLAQGNKVLLMLSCGRMNKNLKKIAAICGIEKRLIFHVARHTFATIISYAYILLIVCQLIAGNHKMLMDK